MSTYRTSSKKTNDEDTSSVSLVFHSSKDVENNDDTFIDDNGQAEVGDTGNPFRITRRNMMYGLYEIDKPEVFDKLSKAIQNHDLERLQNSMDKLCPSKYDKVKMILHCPPSDFKTNPSQVFLIAQAMLFDLRCFKYLLELYEKLKPTLEELQPSEKWSEDYLLIYLPFSVDGFYSEENLLHNLRGEDAIIKLEYLSKCSIFDYLINYNNRYDKVTPLMMAIMLDEIPLAEKMVELGAYIDSVSRDGESPIYLAVLHGHLNLIKKMLQIGKAKCPDIKDFSNDKIYLREGRSIFYPAIISGNMEVIQYLQSVDVQNSTTFLSKQMKNENRGPLVDCIVRNNMTDLLNFFLKLKENSSENHLPDSVIAEICMRAVELNNDELVSIIVKSQYGRQTLKFTDNSGRNVLHQASKYPKLLEYLLDTVEQIFDKTSDTRDVINKADKNKCTALHYAAMAGNGESLQALAKRSVRINNHVKDLECDYILSCVTCEKCAEKISLKAIKHAIEKSTSDENPTVQLTKDVLFNALALKGRCDLLQYLLDIKVPGSKKSDRNGSTALHAAVCSGSLPTVKLIVERLPSLLNVKNRLLNTPAIVAAEEGQHDILKYLFESGVKPVDESTGVNLLTSWYDDETSIQIIDEILKTSGRKGLTEVIFGEDLRRFKNWRYRAKVAVHIFDAYIWKDKSGYIYDFTPLKGLNGNYTEVISDLIILKQEKSLSHPLVRTFLMTKLTSKTAQKWYFLNAFLYFVFLIFLSTYIGLYSQASSSSTSPAMISLTVSILFLSSINMIKELLQMFNSQSKYFTEDILNNILEWILYICTFVFLLPVNEVKTKSQIEAGAIAIFVAWINFVWFLKLLPMFGIYIVLTKEVFMSLLKILPVVLLFVIAFAMTFLLLRNNDYAFSTVPWSALTTLIMMGGEIDYRDVFIGSKSEVYIIQCVFLVLFFLLMGIVLMNVLVGLAVGDTDKMMKTSKLERRLRKAKLYIELEKSLLKLPSYFRPKVIEWVGFAVPCKDEKDDDDDSEKETSIEDIKSELQKIKHDIKHDMAELVKEISEMKCHLETVLNRNEENNKSN